MFTRYWQFADRYGWPPTVVDDQPWLVMDRLMEITLLVEEVRREQAEADAKG